MQYGDNVDAYKSLSTAQQYHCGGDTVRYTFIKVLINMHFSPIAVAAIFNTNPPTAVLPLRNLWSRTVTALIVFVYEVSFVVGDG